MKLKGIVRVVIGLLLMSSLAITAGCQSSSQDNVGEVNGDKITETQYEQHYKLLKLNYEMQMGELDEKNKELVKSLKDRSFDDLVMQKLIWQETEKRSITVSEKEIDQAITEVKEYKNSQEADGFKKFLDKNGLTEEMLREELKTEKLFWKLEEEVTKGTQVSDQEIKKYYEDNPEQFRQPAGIHMYHILVEKEQEANQVLDLLKQGKSFAEVASQYSIDPSNKDAGGDLGIVNQDTPFVNEFKQAALALKPGETTSQPVKTEFGYHIIKAGERQEEKIIPFEEAQSGLKDILLKQKQQEEYSKFLEDLRNKADVKDYRQK